VHITAACMLACMIELAADAI